MDDKIYKYGEYPPGLKDRIAEVLSSILSDKYDCKITLKWVPKDGSGVKTDDRNQAAVC